MAPKKTHGMSRSREYACWKALKNRCTNPKNNQWKDYGGRGITVSERWMDFINFFEDLGKIPEGMEIDRIDNNKGYSKENCRYVSKKENSRNRRTTKIHKIDQEKFVQQKLIELIGWTKNQFRWFRDRYGINWILENFRDGTLPKKTNISLDENEILGSKFGDWEVIRFIGRKKSSGNIYLCKCKCGIEKEVVGYNLRSGKSTRCRSCAYHAQIIKPNIKKAQ